MKKLFCLSSILIINLSYTLKVNAFWDQGHQLIGEIANKKITSQTQTEVKKLLNIEISYPGSIELSKNTNSMDTAASWADSIKSYREQEINSRFSKCHYSDIPIQKDMIGSEVNEKNALALLKKEVIDKSQYNSVSCLKRSIKTLITESESDTNKAIALRMIIHIVGDIGQPLHNADLVDGDFKDEGGNKTKLERTVSLTNIDGSAAYQNNLHKIWDGTLGVYLQFPYNNEDSKRGIFTPEERKSTQYDAEDILKRKSSIRLPMEAEYEKGIKIQTIEDWIVDSYKLAVKYAYTDLILKDTSNNSIASLFSDSWKMYQAPRKKIIDSQILKSGNRLADLLNAIYDPRESCKHYLKIVNSIQDDDSIKPLTSKY